MKEYRCYQNFFTGSLRIFHLLKKKLPSSKASLSSETVNYFFDPDQTQYHLLALLFFVTLQETEIKVTSILSLEHPTILPLNSSLQPQTQNKIKAGNFCPDQQALVRKFLPLRIHIITAGQTRERKINKFNETLTFQQKFSPKVNMTHEMSINLKDLLLEPHWQLCFLTQQVPPAVNVKTGFSLIWQPRKHIIFCSYLATYLYLHVYLYYTYKYTLFTYINNIYILFTLYIHIIYIIHIYDSSIFSPLPCCQ